MGFGDFLGNPAAIATVRKMLAQDSAPGSLLFAGPSGVGKKTLAEMLAKALNCERLPDDFCGQCRNCVKAEEMLTVARQDLARRREIKDASRRVDGLTYFDVQLIEPITRYVLIEQIRQLRVVAYTRPFELPRRVFIIDEAQAIHWQAVDLLLKVMEEPPPTTTFILVCSNAHELRPTVRSRCRHVPFLPVEDALIEAVLGEEKRIPAPQISLAAKVAGGSIGEAKKFDLADFEQRRKPWIGFLNGIASQPGRPMAPANWKALFDSTKALSENRADLDNVLALGYSLLNDMLNILETPRAARLTHLDLDADLRAWAAALGIDGIERLKNGLDDVRRHEIRNVNQQLSWDALAIDLIPGAAAPRRSIDR